MLAHFLRWQPDVKLSPRPVQARWAVCQPGPFLPPSRKHVVERLEQPVAVSALERRLELTRHARRVHDGPALAQPLRAHAPPHVRLPAVAHEAEAHAVHGACDLVAGDDLLEARAQRAADDAAFSCRPSSSSTSSTASPISQDTGLPPTEAKNHRDPRAIRDLARGARGGASDGRCRWPSRS